MKPAPFRYIAPGTLDEALAALGDYGDEAKALAGGQSLIPAMNFRLAQPGVLVDLNPVAELAYLEPAADGGLRIGAMTRQRAVERSALAAQRAPLLHAAMPYVAHVQIRNRGTIGGSLAHADPAAELPAVAVALGGRLRLQSRRGERWMAAADFYQGLFTTALAPDEIVAEAALPPMPAQSGWSILEIARRRGDYALAGVAVVVTMAGGHCEQATLVFFGVGDGPVQAPSAARLLAGEPPTQAAVVAAAAAAAEQDLDPPGDIHASAEFRRHLAKVLARRALVEAFTRAGAALN
ncbi:MAG TPA: xanthine dehydrogenase family protein subunit M [Caldilineaceae bacterium]|nr:xanthine dehydrogenase family protein subunit M [Caldilineaceae bacterium]